MRQIVVRIALWIDMRDHLGDVAECLSQALSGKRAYVMSFRDGDAWADHKVNLDNRASAREA
jgi:hypothetical protein